MVAIEAELFVIRRFDAPHSGAIAPDADAIAVFSKWKLFSVAL
jgi:hypothetical protein